MCAGVNSSIFPATPGDMKFQLFTKGKEAGCNGEETFESHMHIAKEKVIQSQQLSQGQEERR